MKMAGRPDTAARAPRVLIAGGGTGGHVYPGLAVAEELRRLAPATEIRFAGTRRGIEARLVPAAGWRLHTMPASGLRGLGPAARLLFAANFAAGCAVAGMLLLRWRPDVVLGTGGYVSAPALMAAYGWGCPVALQEQNAIPGAANRFLARLTRRVYLGTPAAAERFVGRDCLVTGNPVRASLAAAAAAAPATPLARGAAAARLRLLVFGGSRGAGTLNRAVRELARLRAERADFDLLVQTGTAEQEAVATALAAWPRDRARVVAYIEDMAAALTWADLVVCRAGAMTLAELAATGRPAVLVPYPHAADDHQTRNAREVAAAGAAVLLPDAQCDAAALATHLDSFARDPARLAAMARASARLARPDAAKRIAEDLLCLAGRLPAAT